MPDDSAKLNGDQIKLIQQLVVVCLYYGRAVEDTILPAPSAIASEQSNGTKGTMIKKTVQLLDYLVTHPAENVRFHVSSMVLNIHSDASYFSQPKVDSRVIFSWAKSLRKVRTSK